MDLNLKDKVVLVSGSSRGIGLSIAKAFLNEGAKVIITGRDYESLAHAKRSIQSLDANLLAIRCDFSNEDEVKILKKSILEKWNKLDVLVCNAGSGRSTHANVPRRSDFESMLSINFYTATNPISVFMDDLIEHKGNIVCVSSIAGIEALGAPVAYSTAKTALMAFVKNLAKRIGPLGVRANCIAPGNIYFQGGVWDIKSAENPENVQKMIQEKVPLQRFGEPDDVAQACLFLSSKVASFITGSVLVVDGGQTSQLF